MIPKREDVKSLLAEVRSGDKRRALIAMRDSIARELETNLCPTCLNSRLRTGDQAALYLRLQKVIDELDRMPSSEQKSELDELTAARIARLGTPSGTRRRQGGMRSPRAPDGGGISL